MDKGSTAAGAAVPQSQYLQQSLKRLFMWLATSFVVAVAIRLLALPATGRDESILFLLPSMLAVPMITAAWFRVAYRGIKWQVGLSLLGVAGVGVTAFQGGAITLWILPLAGALCVLLVALVGLQEASIRRRTWGLTLRQWTLVALFACAIVGIGLIAWFSHPGVGREANVLIRSVRGSLLILLAWTAAISLCLAGVNTKQARKLLFLIILLTISVSNFAILHLDPFLNQFSSQIISLPVQIWTIPILVLAAAAGLIFPRWINSITLTGFLAAVWLHGSTLHPTNVVGLALAGLAGLFISTHRWPLAAAYWAALLAVPFISVGTTNPLFLVNAMGGTIVFAGSYSLSRILEAYSKQHEAEGRAAGKTVQPSQASAAIDNRSAVTGLVAAAGIALFGAALLYIDDNRGREQAHRDASAVAVRLSSRISAHLLDSERLAKGLSHVDLEMLTDQTAFERETNPFTDFSPGDVLQWAPQAVVRFVNPLQGNEQAVGLDLLAMPEQQTAVRSVITTGEPRWTGPFALVQGGQALIYRVPVYRPGALPSEASFIGLAQVIVNLEDLIQDNIQFDQEGYDVTVWVTNSLTGNAATEPQQVWGSSSPDERYADLAGVAEASITQDGDGESLKVRVEARPLEVETLETLPARLQGLLILTLLAGIAVAFYAANRRRVIAANAAVAEFKHTLDQTQDAVFMFDADTLAFTYFNQGTCDQLGYSKAELLGMHPYDINPDYPEPEFRQLIAPLLDGTKTSIRLEAVHRHKDGHGVPVEAYIQMFEQADGKRHFLAITTDITERKAVEAALRESEAFQSALLEGAGAAIIATDPDGVIKLFNPAAEALLEYTAEELVGKATPEIFHDRDEVIARAQSLSKELGYTIEPGFEVFAAKARLSRADTKEWTYVSKSGIRHPVILSVSAIRDNVGKISAFLGVGRDITERKEAEASLREQEAQFRQLFMGSTAALILVDKSGRIRMANHEACSVFEYTNQELVGMSIDLLLPEALRAGENALRDRYLEQGAPTWPSSKRDLQAVTRNGRVLDFELGLTRMVIGDEEMVLASIIDISHRKRAEFARNQFIANISHELRTPLNAVLGYARMLERAPLEGEHKAQLQRLSQASSMLLGLVNDVLDWAKIEAGEIDLDNEPFSLPSACETLHSVMGGQAQDKGLGFSWNQASDLPHYVIGDSTRFQQIMFNLIGNAIKFTDKGEIHVDASVLPCGDPDKVRLMFEVSDTGIGISEEDQPYLFERFRQLDQSATRRFQGTGLGLAIVKELAELMGGCVRVQSKPGIGSTFTIELEFGRCDDLALDPAGQHEAAAEQQEKPLAGKHILLVDDSDLIVELTEMLLETAGAQVSSCNNGQEALDWLVENRGKVDIVLLDVHMPVMDGNTAVAMMRRDPDLKGLPVIGMTAGATRTSIDEALAAGMTDCITKPFTEGQLIETVLKHGRLRGKNRIQD